MPLTSRRLKLSKVTGYGTRPGRRRSIKRKARKSRQWLVRRDVPPAKADVPLDELANPVMSGGRTYRDAMDQKGAERCSYRVVSRPNFCVLLALLTVPQEI